MRWGCARDGDDIVNILFAPAHYLLDGVSGGSEYGWAYGIINTLSTQSDLRLFVVTGMVRSDKRLPANVTLIRLGGSPTLKFSSSYRLAFVGRYYLAAQRILHQHRIDVIHHIGPFGYGTTFNLLPLLGATRRIPFVIGPLQVPHTMQGGEEQTFSQEDVRSGPTASDAAREQLSAALIRAGRPILHGLSTRTLRDSDYLVAVNKQARDLYASVTPNIPAVVIPPGVDTNRFGQVSALDRDRGNRDGDSGVDILYVGWLFVRKGLDLVIAAMARLVPRYPSLRLHIIGDGPQRGALEVLVARSNLGPNVIFEGVVENAALATRYAHADIFVSMSYSESFGQTLIEGMISGLPVVSARNMGSNEIIEDGETGYLVEPGNVAMLVERLDTLISRPDLRVSLGQRARDVVRRRYNWTTIGEQYHDVYREAVRRRARVTR